MALIHVVEKPRGEVTVAVEGYNVVLISDGQRILEIPWRAAQRLSVALKKQANKAEEQEKAYEIIHDNAILLRSGWGWLGLSNDPHIKKETEVEAAHNPELRKYVRKGAGDIQSRGAVGTPGLIKHPPKKEVNDELR